VSLWIGTRLNLLVFDLLSFVYLSPATHAISEDEEEATEDADFDCEDEEGEEAYDPSPESGFINGLKQRELRAREASNSGQQQEADDEYDIDVDVDNIDEGDDDDY
jgi:hypothetical protein